jgi:hypothetical protein
MKAAAIVIAMIPAGYFLVFTVVDSFPSCHSRETVRANAAHRKPSGMGVSQPESPGKSGRRPFWYYKN